MTHLPQPPASTAGLAPESTNQRVFLKHLAIVGSVTLATKHVGGRS